MFPDQRGAPPIFDSTQPGLSILRDSYYFQPTGTDTTTVDLKTMMTPTQNKPLLRGHLHQMAFFTALGACILLIAKSSSPRATVAGVVYTFGLLLMLGVSTLYHRPKWRPSQLSIMKRFDHSAIFVMIAGTMTPVCMLALSKTQGSRVLTMVWVAAAIGILKTNLWLKAPKAINISLYIVMGWLMFPFLTELQQSLGSGNVWLLVVGGVIYTLGAIVYGTQKPNISPRFFGYHEVFHAFTIVAAIFHFVVIYRLID